MKFETIEKNARHASMLLKAMSNPHRLLILCQLTSGEKCVGELESIVGLSQSALSQHLARLRRDNLVKTRRMAQTIYYSLAADDVEILIDALHGLYQQSHSAVASAYKKAGKSREAVPAV
ncbi:MAG: metalloregulator ArsR/SmtB family transcription factor [Rhodospirillales bacterium]